MKKILQVNFKATNTRAEVQQAFLKMGYTPQFFAQFKGLKWKIWIVDDAENSGGAIYLFEDEASVEAYLKEVVAKLKTLPALKDVEAKVFNIIPEPTKITRGPVD